MFRTLGLIRSIPVVAFLVLAASSAGCNEKMALTRDATSLDTKTNSVAIFTLKVKNDANHACETNARDIQVLSDGGAKFDKRYDLGPFWKTPPDETNETKEYLVSLALPPGNYKIGEVRGTSVIPWVIDAHFEFPVGARFSVPPDSVVYVGHASMVNRDAKDNEPRSGGAFPLIPQGVAGFTNGTFDITIADGTADIDAFQQNFPVLKDRQIVKSHMVRP